MIFFLIFGPRCHGNHIEIDEIGPFFMQVFLSDFLTYFYV